MFYKNYFRYIIPSMISFTLTGIYTIIDGLFIGQKVGYLGLAAVGIAWPVAAITYAIGEGLGRFVYWMDAWKDQKQDFRQGNYNPLTQYRKEPDADLFVKEIMEMMMGEATSFFEALPLEKDLDLLRNVLYSGVWQRYEFLRERQEKERKKS